MLQETNGAIVEPYQGTTTLTTNSGSYTGGSLSVGGTFQTIGYYQPWPQTVYWNSYPVYVCTDKTKKAIEVLKALQADKLLKCDSVPRFIALVEKISNIL